MAFESLIRVGLVLTIGPLLINADNYQSWSYQVYKDEPFALECKNKTMPLEPSDSISWERYGMGGVLADDDHYDLRAHDGVANSVLYVRKVTDQTRGIYICRIDKGAHQESVVLGLNIGVHKYRDDIDKYRWNIIVGVIAGASVFVFIISICLINHFRYLSEESLEKRRNRKLAHLRMESPKNGLSNTAYENVGSSVPDLSQPNTELDGTQVNYL